MGMITGVKCSIAFDFKYTLPIALNQRGWHTLTVWSLGVPAQLEFTLCVCVCVRERESKEENSYVIS